MKVCTDATLFGAMAPVRGGERVLDIGTGTGLLALMAAQLGAAQVTGVEIMEGASTEAASNFRNSPWADRLQVVHQDIQGYATQAVMKYDVVISNPPFFKGHTRSADRSRNMARHTDPLSHGELIQAMHQLLDNDGLGYLLMPSVAVEKTVEVAKSKGLYLLQRTDIRGFEHKPSKVAALTLGRKARPLAHEIMTIYRGEKDYTAQCRSYLSPFLLRFADEGISRL